MVQNRSKKILKVSISINPKPSQNRSQGLRAIDAYIPDPLKTLSNHPVISTLARLLHVASEIPRNRI